MVQVIGELEEAGVIRFRVHRSSRDPNRILGSWHYAVDEPGRVGSIGQNEPGASAEIEYQRARSWTADHGVQFLWVDDPNVLFPPAQRPTPS